MPAPSRRLAKRLRVDSRPDVLEVWDQERGWHELPGTLMDVSDTGVGLLVYRHLAPGTPVRVAIAGEGGAHDHAARLGKEGQVVRAETHQGLWRLGVIYRPVAPNAGERLMIHVVCFGVIAMIWGGSAGGAHSPAELIALALFTLFLLGLAVGGEVLYREKRTWYRNQLVAWHERLLDDARNQQPEAASGAPFVIPEYQADADAPVTPALGAGVLVPA